MAEAAPAGDGKEEEATRLWAACHSTPWDFDTWMALIPFLERGGEPMRPKLKEAYEEFLVEFPLCYGYWDKLAKFEKAGEGGVEEALKVYERGLVAVPCIELYVSYCGCAVDAAGPPSADGEPIGAGEVRARETFEKAVLAVGGEWKSVSLWDYFVRFEEGRGGADKDARIAALSLRAASLPTGCAEKHMGSLRTMLEEKEGATEAVLAALPEEERAECMKAEEGEERKKAVLAAAEKTHEKVKGEIQKRAPFEDKILRPYFHVKPLALDQKENWHAYIDNAVSEGNTALALKLFERCLIPCALYVEFWEKYASFLEEQGNIEAAREVVERGCKGPFKRRPDLKLVLALYEEAMGRHEAAETVYNELAEHSAPDSVEIVIRLANFYRRRQLGSPPGADDKASKIYEAAIKRFSDKEDLGAYTFLSIHYATMLAQVVGDMSKAREVLGAALAANPSSKNLVQAYVHLELAHGGAEAEEHVRAAYLAAIEEKSVLAAEDKVELQTEYVDFEHDRGSDLARLRAAQSALRRVLLARATEEQRRLAAHKRPAAGASPAHDPKRPRPTALPPAPYAAAQPAYPGTAGYDPHAYQAWYAQQYQQPYQAAPQYGYGQQYPAYGY